MDSAAKESILPDRLSERLGGLILKDEQRLAVEALMSGKDVLAVLPTGFGKSVIYQSFVITKDSSSTFVIIPLRSIIDDQLQCCRMAVLFEFSRHVRWLLLCDPLARWMLKNDVYCCLPILLRYVLYQTVSTVVFDDFFPIA
ncbi:unnamed protein product [Porites lobata]|uniref:DEAD/DEAH-box helicase domain-containing protein n=1 Tax=Porites lobata TaxID=104759 RepID=A0ABN8Q568_9CNID|nr:unnamed protein product [Porites lobata]